MKTLKNNFWLLFSLSVLIFIFFNKVFIFGQIPLPADLTVGSYYPWLDYKWGYAVGVPVKNPITSDVVSVIYPLKNLAVNALRDGQTPFWNSTMFVGYPLLANFQIGIFSPTIIFYFLLPHLTAWTAQVIIQPFLAALFTYLLLRHFQISRTGSFFGGIFYAFSGFILIWLEWNAHSLAAAFIPLLFLLTDKFLTTGRSKWGIILAIALALQIFAGYPQIVFFTLGALLLFFVFRREMSLKRFFLFLFFLSTGVLLSAIQSLPAAELILLSQRRGEWLSPELTYLPWQNLITFFAPDFFGNHATANFWGQGNYTSNVGYSGLITFLLASGGVVQFWHKKEVRYFLTLFVLTLVFSLPTPLAKLITHSRLPGLSAASNTRILVLANLSLAVLAGFGIESWEKLKRNDFRIFYLPALFLITGLFWALTQNQTVALRNLVLPFALLFLSFFVFFVRKKVFLWFLLLTAVFELFRFGWKYTPFVAPKLVFPETPVIKFLKNQPGPFRIAFDQTIPMNMWVPYGLESVSGYDAAYPASWAKLLAVIKNKNRTAPAVGRYAEFNLYSDPWFNFLNNKYVLTLKESQLLGDPDFEVVFRDGSVVVLENKEVLPRAFLFYDWVSLDDDAAVLEELTDLNFPLKEKIILSQGYRTPPQVLGKGKVEFIETNPFPKLKITSNQDGLLFLSEAWYPGWKARVDGHETPIYRANYAFRAVPISPGNHEVEFIYDPLSFKMGQWLTVATAIFLAGIFLHEQKNQNRR